MPDMHLRRDCFAAQTHCTALARNDKLVYTCSSYPNLLPFTFNPLPLTFSQLLTPQTPYRVGYSCFYGLET
jgi:hypothetical protein